MGFPERYKRKGKEPAEKPGDPAGPTVLGCCSMHTNRGLLFPWAVKSGICFTFHRQVNMGAFSWKQAFWRASKKIITFVLSWNQVSY